MPKVYNKHHKNYPPSAVYVGRPTKWGNPYTVADYGKDKAIELYEMYLDQLNPELAEDAKRELRGKDLVCWCAPKPCHADVLLRIANE